MKKKEKETNNKKLWLILGIIGFAAYILVYIVGRTSTILLYHIPVASQILGILKILLLNSFIMCYIIFSSKKSNKVLNILLLVVFLLFIISNSVDIIHQLRILIHYGGNKIYYCLIILHTFLGILQYILMGISVLSLIINKKIAPKVLWIISLVMVGILIITSILTNFWSFSMGMNIRNTLNIITNILQAIFFGLFQASYIGMIYENTKEIK